VTVRINNIQLTLTSLYWKHWIILQFNVPHLPAIVPVRKSCRSRWLSTFWPLRLMIVNLVFLVTTDDCFSIKWKFLLKICKKVIKMYLNYVILNLSNLIPKCSLSKAKQKICVFPINPKILPPTLTFFMPKEKIDRQNPEILLFQCLFPNSTIDAWLLRYWRNFPNFLVHLIVVWNQKHCTACQIINKL
jgi:hypothetical protein